MNWFQNQEMHEYKLVIYTYMCTPMSVLEKASRWTWPCAKNMRTYMDALRSLTPSKKRKDDREK